MLYEDHGRAKEVVAEHEVNGRYERLGVRAVEERGRQTLANRWDTELYEEGLQSSRERDLLGDPESAIRTAALTDAPAISAER